MKAVIVSDSHGNSEILEKIFRNERNADCIIHLGDGAGDLQLLTEFTGRIPVYNIKGNNDFYCHDAVPRVISYMGRIRFFACHGHLLDVKYGLTRLYYSAEQEQCRLALFGHTHIPHNEQMGDITLFNPGCAYKGYYGVLETDGDRFSIVHRNVYT